MSEHTSGPWIVTEIEDCYCVANCGRYVIVPERGKVKADNSAADAALIAAAPELLEALEDAVQYLRHHLPCDALAPHLAAIAKARGN